MSMVDNIIEILNNKKKPSLFFCGIGGIGMSGLALLAQSCGYKVSGSDLVENKNTKHLVQHGIKIFIGHNAQNIVDNDIFIYSSAVNTNTNPEALEAKKKGIPLIKRGDMVSILMRHYFNIIVCGSHGKTTTTGLIGHMMDGLNLQPNVLIGGVLNSCNTNCKVGKGKYFIMEADESDGTFTVAPADIAVITNIDPEHMEFYKTNEKLEKYFIEFAHKGLQKAGTVICQDSKIGTDIIHKLKSECAEKLITYSITDKNADFYAENIIHKKDGIVFDVIDNIAKQEHKNIFLSNMFGNHNVLNLLAALGVATLTGQSVAEAVKTFANFNGIQKRFTILGQIQHSLIVDDYAHNPQKIACAINSTKHYIECNNLGKNFTIVFEPHRYTRWRDGKELFTKALSQADHVIVIPIYASSEEPIPGIDDEHVFNELKKVCKDVVHTSDNAKEIRAAIEAILSKDKQNSITIFMGAGKSSRLAHEVVELN
ncbi:MAG: UDP-N-acetylmuramate--L-alanine ligase [Rickettsiales bacterium]|nr:UDP-N-acetylmuramate--L-alanine ligase [Rickettsiales bacterium]